MPDPKNTLGEALTIPKLRLDQAIRNSEVKAERHSFGRDGKQYYLYFEPSGAIKQRVVVYIHGGGWMSGSPNRYRYIGKLFSDMGYHTLSLGYRHAPLFKYPVQADDIFTAFAKGMTLLESKGVNTDTSSSSDLRRAVISAEFLRTIKAAVRNSGSTGKKSED